MRRRTSVDCSTAGAVHGRLQGQHLLAGFTESKAILIHAGVLVWRVLRPGQELSSSTSRGRENGQNGRQAATPAAGTTTARGRISGAATAQAVGTDILPTMFADPMRAQSAIDRLTGNATASRAPPR